MPPALSLPLSITHMHAHTYARAHISASILSRSTELEMQGLLFEYIQRKDGNLGRLFSHGSIEKCPEAREAHPNTSRRMV